MVKFSSFPVLAAMFCIASLISCNSTEPDDPQPTPSSSSVSPSSSSVVVSSSSDVVSSSSSVQLGSSSSSSSIATNEPDLVKKNITLSYAGNSYADIDGNITTYKQADAASNPKKIDLIAYCGSMCADNSGSIYAPKLIDLFWANDFENYLGGDVDFFEITPEQAEVFKTAKKYSEVQYIMKDIIDSYNETEDLVYEIPIAAGRAFFVYTSEYEKCIVIIKTAGDKSIDLEVIQIPY
ncbi:MAG: hypothetical protein LBC75_10290 [Fibromonadaceae bacterium]|jgi:hypothetical protein|nr:hypothetical protein [Fibromonadaceae bacterium]